jgi:hypothetical protein
MNIGSKIVRKADEVLYWVLTVKVGRATIAEDGLHVTVEIDGGGGPDSNPLETGRAVLTFPPAQAVALCRLLAQVEEPMTEMMEAEAMEDARIHYGETENGLPPDTYW